jgi:predicted restriction endonuclease
MSPEEKKRRKNERKIKRNAKRQAAYENRVRTIGTAINPNSDAFLESFEWRRVRMAVLKKYGARCQCCGATPKDGVRMHVDHIKPRKIFPELALDQTNLQVLCEVCNHGKGNWDFTDWRETELDDEAIKHLTSI